MQPLHAIQLRQLAEVDSTNDEAKRYALACPDGHGLLFIAEKQTSGRGRMGRQWISLPGNLHASLLLKPGIALGPLQDMVKLAAVAIHDSLTALGLKPRIKAPNDLLIEGKKLCGILVESVVQGEAPPAVVVGFGLNITSHPEETDTPATHLAAFPQPVPERTALAGMLAESLRRRYEAWRIEGFSTIEESYHAAGG